MTKNDLVKQLLEKVSCVDATIILNKLIDSVAPKWLNGLTYSELNLLLGNVNIVKCMGISSPLPNSKITTEVFIQSSKIGGFISYKFYTISPNGILTNITDSIENYTFNLLYTEVANG